MILCFNRLHISAKQLYQLIPERRHKPLKRMSDHNEDQRRGDQGGQLVRRRSEKSCCLDWFLFFAVFFRQFYLICSITSWRLCSFTLVFPTSWKKILFQDDDAACFDDMILFIWFLLRFWRNFHFLFHLVNPAVEQGVLSKVHDRLLRSKACVSFHPLVFFLLWAALIGRLDLCSKMVPLTKCLNSGESLPVPRLELNWM